MLYPTYKNFKGNDNLYKHEEALEAELQLSQKHAFGLYQKAIYIANINTQNHIFIGIATFIHSCKKLHDW